MKVLIDGVEYAPVNKVQTDNKLLQALEVRFDSDAGKNLSIRQYFERLLMTLWKEQEGFRGKRPFGNSGWYLDVYCPLIENGFITGSLDEDGCVAYYDREGADEFVKKLILACFYGAKPE